MSNAYAILGTAGCKKTLNAIDYLQPRINIMPIVIFETKIRLTYTPSQISFKRNHLLFTWQNATKRKERIFALLKLFGLSLFLITPNIVKKPLFFAIGNIRSFLFSYELNKRGVRFFSVEKISTNYTKSILLNHGITWAFLASSQWILNSDVISCEYNIINFHPGILPTHRSLDSFFWSILDLDGIGVSAHIVDCGIDTGPLIKRFFFITGDLDLMELRKSVDQRFPDFVYILLKFVLNQDINLISQYKEDGQHHHPMGLKELYLTDQVLKNVYLRYI